MKSSKFKVLVGINDKEFDIITKSLTSRNLLKGKFMSPIIAMVSQYEIANGYVARNLTATSSRLSLTAMKNPLQFYKLMWTIATKSLSLVRTPQARPLLEQKIPSFVDSYLKEGSEVMSLKLLNEVRNGESFEKFVAVVPMENLEDVYQSLNSRELEKLARDAVDMRLNVLQKDSVGLWIPVLVMYCIFPIAFLIKGLKYIGNAEIGELANFETEGVVIIGSWVRDKRRD